MTRAQTEEEHIDKIVQSLSPKWIGGVPGWGATEFVNRYENGTFFLHEEVLYGAALGSSLAGVPSIIAMKTHGLAKSMNAVLASVSTGVAAPLICIVMDDPLGQSSDNVLNTQKLLKATELPYFKPHEYKAAIKFSTRNRLPGLVHVDCRKLSNLSPLRSSKLKPRLQRAKPLDFLVTGCNPLASQFLRQQTRARLRANPKTGPRPHPPLVPDALPAKYREGWSRLHALGLTLKGLSRTYRVHADAGISSLLGYPPYSAVHTTAYLGGSTAMALGCALSGVKAMWLCGDFSFASAAHLGLLEAINLNIPLNGILFDNGSALATGGQVSHRKGLDHLLSSFSHCSVGIESLSAESLQSSWESSSCKQSFVCLR